VKARSRIGQVGVGFPGKSSIGVIEKKVSRRGTKGRHRKSHQEIHFAFEKNRLHCRARLHHGDILGFFLVF